VNRWADWWNQANRDLNHARNARDDADFEWAAFAAQQAAEKATKAVIMAHGGVPWGHSLALLIDNLPPDIRIGTDLREAALRLDKHYIPARYPNGFAAGHPGMYYTRREAEGAIEDATALIELWRGHLPRPE
jgi:HEPN domain-containing protein